MQHTDADSNHTFSRSPDLERDAASVDKVVFSIGHSNQTLEDFVGLLILHRIEVLADVRSKPFSRFVPHFNQSSLKPTIQEVGMRYVFLGQELGGRPEGAEYYDDQGHVLYGRVAESPLFLEGIERLERGMRQFRVAMMCSEEDPVSCHRYRLIGQVIKRRDVKLLHIRGDGRVETNESVFARDEQTVTQLSFFASQPEDEAWRSTRSVLPKSPLPTSSGSSNAPE